MSEQNTDREALGDIIDDWLTDPDHIDTGFLADAILNSEWLADLIRREREKAWDEGAWAGASAYDFGSTVPRGKTYLLTEDGESIPNPYRRGENA